MIKCDAIKYSYRQSKDGFVVAFVLHPNEVPPELANADIGSQWQLSLVPLNSDGNPDIGTHSRPIEPPRQVQVETEPVGAKERRSFDSLPLAQQAGILCKERSFQKFTVSANEEDAAISVRNTCKVPFRSQIGTPEYPKSAAVWRRIVSDYRAWMLEAQVVG